MTMNTIKVDNTVRALRANPKRAGNGVGGLGEFEPCSEVGSEVNVISWSLCMRTGTSLLHVLGLGLRN